MLASARRRLAAQPNVEFRPGELDALPIASEELDVVLLSLVLHHAPDPGPTLTEVARVLRPGGRVLVIDMLPHDREEYQQQMGHVWLGFAEKQVLRFLAGAGLADARIHALPVDPQAGGPALFAAIAVKTGRGHSRIEGPDTDEGTGRPPAGSDEPFAKEMS
jgi:ArsR family transcriptional regulator